MPRSIPGAERRLEDLVLGHPLPGQLRNEPTLRMTRTRWASPRISSISLEISRTPCPRRRVGRSARTGRASRPRRPRGSARRRGGRPARRASPARRAASAGSHRRARQRGPRGSARPRLLQRLADRGPFLAPAHEPEAGHVPMLGRLTFSRTGRRSSRPSSLRDSGIIASPVRSEPPASPSAGHRLGAAPRRRAARPRDGPGEPRSAGPDQPGQPDDLPGMQLERDVVDTRGRNAPDREDHGGIGGRWPLSG